MNAPERIRLTQFSHGGGCGCKIAPAVLTEILANSPLKGLPGELLVGTETSDDAAVYRLNDSQALVATTDFFTPIVDDPYDFGRIAATNAISDVYAMGGKPIMALAILGMPVDKIPVEMVREILKGGAAVCGTAGIPVAGGHSIDCPEPVYGLAVIGTCHPSQVRRNSEAKPGDTLILTKPVGVGIYSAAIKKSALPPAAYQEMVTATTTLNRIGAELGKDPDVHAVTDVTGFGVLGHALELARGSKLSVVVEVDRVPLLADAATLAEKGFVTGASHRNWASYSASIVLPPDLPDWRRHLLTDPQTSGGLLVACAPERSESIVRLIQEEGHAAASVIGHAEEGKPGVTVRA